MSEVEEVEKRRHDHARIPIDSTLGNHSVRDSLSTGETEYYALVKGSGQAIGLCSVIRELGMQIGRDSNVLQQMRTAMLK